MPSESEELRIAISEAFREFFRIVSIVYLTNPPQFEELERDPEFQRALDRLVSALAKK